MILILPRHCRIYNPDSSPSLFYIWSWFFPVTVLYMILILSRHSLSYIWSWFVHVTVLYMILILARHSLSYISSWFFPVTVLYMILFLPRHCLIYYPDSSHKTVTWKNQDYIYDSDEEESGSFIRQWRGRIRIIYMTVKGKNQDHI
jgi:hypothetical protein